MEKDPLFDPIRQRSQFGEMRQAAIQCQQNFLAHREQVGHGHSIERSKQVVSPPAAEQIVVCKF
jgi:hypothetical protein